MEAKGSFSMILLIIIAILALSLAGLTGYVFFFAGPTEPVETTTHEVVRPADSELSSKLLYEKENLFNLKSTDSKMSVLQANVEVVCFKKVNGIKSTDDKLAAYDGAIKELISTYFQNMTIEEARLPQTKTKAKQELTKSINALLSSSEKEQKDIVYTINFNEWFYQ